MKPPSPTRLPLELLDAALLDDVPLDPLAVLAERPEEPPLPELPEELVDEADVLPKPVEPLVPNELPCAVLLEPVAPPEEVAPPLEEAFPGTPQIPLRQLSPAPHCASVVHAKRRDW